MVGAAEAAEAATEEVAAEGLEEEDSSRLRDLENKDSLRRRTILPWDKDPEAIDGPMEQEGMQDTSEITRGEILQIITVGKDRAIVCLDFKRPLVQRREGTQQLLHRSVKPPPHRLKH